MFNKVCNVGEKNFDVIKNARYNNKKNYNIFPYTIFFSWNVPQEFFPQKPLM
jgi:hypothetical protein